MHAAPHLLLIGFGAMARHVARALRTGSDDLRLSVLVRERSRAAAEAAAASDAPAGTRVVTRLDELDAPVELAAECAGHAAVAEHGEACLAAGADFLIASVGALADATLLARLERAAQTHRRKLLIPAGAVAGIDAIAAARQGGLDAVRYASRKPPRAWRGTPAEQLCDLDAIDAPQVFWRGPAGEAARRFPQNANVAATVALAGLGLERTECELCADPAAAGNVHRIEAEGAFGRLSIELAGRPLAENPKTSSLAALSVLRALRNRAAAIEI